MVFDFKLTYTRGGETFIGQGTTDQPDASSAVQNIELAYQKMIADIRVTAIELTARGLDDEGIYATARVIE